MRLFNALGIFMFVAAGLALYAAVTLSWPGTELDRLWAVNPVGHAALLSLGRAWGFPFVLLAVAAVIIGWGWLHRRKYAWYGALIGIGMNLVGDIGRGVSGEWLAGLVGVVAAGLVLTYIAHPRTRAYFD